MSTFTLAKPHDHPVPVPTIANVEAHARRAIHHAATRHWPGSTIHVTDHVPSITGYVARTTVDGTPLYAKYSFLGISLVSLLRGAAGTWPEVQRAQADFVQRPDALLAREHAQLQLLAQLDGPRVCPTAAYEGGVLFTRPVPGPTLGDLLMTTPAQATALLETTLSELRPLYRSRTAGWLGPAGAIGERGIASTFARKFNGISGPTYLAQLGADRLPPKHQEEVQARLRAAVARLRRVRLLPAQTASPVLVYGELKPEHVIFPDGPAGQPQFIDPGLSHGRPSGDVAKLISRTALRLLSAGPGQRTRTAELVAGIDRFAQRRTAALAPKTSRTWQREVLVLWLMDTTNLLSTLLSAPPGLPLNERARALADHPLAACRLVDQVSTDLVRQRDARLTWDRAMTHLLETAS